MKRTDIHSPSKIIPVDYEFVAWHYPLEGFFGQPPEVLAFVADEFYKHRAKTGGKFSNHAHGGNCGCCGAYAKFYAYYYHAKTNSYIKIGWICAGKLDLSFDAGSANIFKKSVRDALKLSKGKKRAQEVLENIGLSEAWQIHVNIDYKQNPHKQERIVDDMVRNLIKYGDFRSEKQVDYLKILLKQIADRPAREKALQEKRALAADCPEGKILVCGTVISKKDVVGPYGEQTKILVESDSGYCIFGTLPAAISSCERGSKIKFLANVKPSPKDSKFGYFKRPSAAQYV